MIQWSIRLLKQNDNWTITPLSHISLMLQYYFLFKGINYNKKKQVIQRRKWSKYKRGVIKVHVRPWMEWHYTVQFLIMPQKSIGKLYSIKSISHHYTIILDQFFLQYEGWQGEGSYWPNQNKLLQKVQSKSHKVEIR